jgi:hypothetical protein
MSPSSVVVAQTTGDKANASEELPTHPAGSLPRWAAGG